MASAFAPEIRRVGPHGYIHGWIHVGGVDTGSKVFHPEHGHGTVIASSGSHVTVAFPGGTHSFERRPAAGPGHLEPRTAHTRATLANGTVGISLTTAERQELRDQVKDAKKRLNPAQRKVIEQWTSGKGMVRKIQNGSVSAASAKAFDDAMREAPKVDGLVYRGVEHGSHGEELFQGLRAGQVMNLDEPVSTSIDPKQSVTFGQYMFEIETPAAAYISGIGSRYAYEQEAVLAPGKYRVVSIQRGKVNRRSGGTAPVGIIRLQDVTPGERSWLKIP